jgi:hypothetical protein
MSTHWVMLYRAAHALEAALLQHALEDDGVPVRSSGGASAAAFGELGAEVLHVELWVPSEHIDQAKRVVERFFARKPRRADSNDAAS